MNIDNYLPPLPSGSIDSLPHFGEWKEMRVNPHDHVVLLNNWENDICHAPTPTDMGNLQHAKTTSIGYRIQIEDQAFPRTLSTKPMVDENKNVNMDWRTKITTGFFMVASLLHMDSTASVRDFGEREGLRDIWLTQTADCSADFADIKKRALRCKLRGYAVLPDDWDGDGGHAPSWKDIENAVRFLEHVPPSALLLDALMVAGDGDVGFDWDTKNGNVEVGFRHGNISFYGKTSAGEEFGGDEQFSGNIPEKLRALVNAVFPA